MKSPETVARVCRAMIDAVEGKTRITVKCRIGIDDVESFEFVSRFVEIIAANAGVDHFIIHARRAWLKGLSPRRNLTVPPLNYPIVYRLAEAYPDLKFVINGGIADIPSVVEHLGRVDGVMLGRKVRDDAWFLADMDQHIYGVPQSAIPSLDSVLASYLAWADETQIKLGTRETILARPLNSLFRGSQGRVFRRHIGSLLTKATSSREESKAGHPRVMFSEITNEALVGAQSECSAKLLSHAKDASSLEPEMTVHPVEAAEA
ncbi:hypothetical protein EV182_003107 [Spiromyces aspiralis]|uniref:Uncharacterized protein n=1 Tax=Spiromyces aspiralis TaxID=68401 RepID=A0ACC1HD49_9FUNG|nr:hypothetical protein EV182_003107 [Spiromyces aspiralis]